MDLGTLVLDAAARMPNVAAGASPDAVEHAMALLRTVSPLGMKGRLPPDRCFIAAPTLDRFAADLPGRRPVAPLG